MSEETVTVSSPLQTCFYFDLSLPSIICAALSTVLAFFAISASMASQHSQLYGNPTGSF